MTRRRRPVNLLTDGSEDLEIENPDIIDVEIVDSIENVQPAPKIRRPPILNKAARPLDFSSPPQGIETTDVAQEVVIPLHNGRRLRETLVPVPCPLYPEILPSPENPQGVKQLVVWFKTNNMISTFSNAKNLPGVSELLDDPMLLLTRIRKVARRFENWNLLDDDGEPVPEPNPGLPETYRILLDDEDLAMWLITDGYIAAVAGTQSKNSASDSTQ